MTTISKTISYKTVNGKRIKVTKTIRKRIIKKIKPKNLSSLLDQIVEEPITQKELVYVTQTRQNQ